MAKPYRKAAPLSLGLAKFLSKVTVRIGPQLNLGMVRPHRKDVLLRLGMAMLLNSKVMDRTYMALKAVTAN